MTPLSHHGESTWERQGVSNPGSDAALVLGCSCPVLDNGRGQGLPPGSHGATVAGPVFWQTVGCPVHRWAQEADANAACAECDGTGGVVDPRQVEAWERSGRNPEHEPESLDCPRCSA